MPNALRERKNVKLYTIIIYTIQNQARRGRGIAGGGAQPGAILRIFFGNCGNKV